jgi:hypothetical protein
VASAVLFFMHLRDLCHVLSRAHKTVARPQPPGKRKLVLGIGLSWWPAEPGGHQCAQAISLQVHLPNESGVRTQYCLLPVPHRRKDTLNNVLVSVHLEQGANRRLQVSDWFHGDRPVKR